MGRKPTDKERKLWKRFTRDVERLREEGASEEEVPAPALDMPPPEPVALPSVSQTIDRPEPVLEPVAEEFLLEPGVTAGVDAQTIRRFRQGKLPLDGTLDLHGLNREQAAFRFMDYLEESQLKGRRVVCIITGHGIGRPDRAPGVLRQALLQWVNWPENRQRILTFDSALPKYGGQGAYMILLRRLR